MSTAIKLITATFSRFFYSLQFSSSEEEEIRISSDSEQDSDSSFETIERRIVISPKKKVKKQESVFYLGLQEAEILGTNEAFQPKLRLENIYDNPERWTSMQLPPLPRQVQTSSSSDSEDEIRTDEEEISKTEFVNKVRRRSESSKSSPDFIEVGSPKPKTIVKKELIERILKEDEPMTSSTKNPETIEIIELD